MEIKYVLTATIIITMSICISHTLIHNDCNSEATEESQDYDFMIDNLCYQVVDSIKNEVEVVHQNAKAIADGMPQINYIGLVNCEVPAEIVFHSIRYCVVGIGFAAFQCCWSLESIRLPDSIRYIKRAAFCSCYQLKSVTLSHEVKMERDVFLDCNESLLTIDYY